jgi:hypothetical protein
MPSQMPSRLRALAARILPNFLEDAAGAAALAVLLIGALALPAGL